MGNCGKANQHKRPENVDRRSSIVSEVPNTGDQKGLLETLQFTVNFSNIKGKNFSPPVDSYLLLLMDNAPPLKTKIVQATKEPVWRIKEDFELNITSRRIRKTYAYLYIKDNTDKELAVFKLNIYDIATGPFHNDFEIDSSKLKGRLSFDLRMSQRIKISVIPESVIATLNEMPFDRNFSISVKLKSTEGVVESEHSEQILNPNYSEGGLARPAKPLKKGESEPENIEENFNPSATGENALLQRPKVATLKKIQSKEAIRPQRERINESISSNALAQKKTMIDPRASIVQKFEKKELKWVFNSKNIADIPTIEALIHTNILSSVTIQFLIWAGDHDESETTSQDDKGVKETNPEKDSQQDFHVIEHKLICECYISLNKLFRDDYYSFELNDNQEYVVPATKKQFTEKMWKSGIIMGNITADLAINTNPFLRQMLCGVRTEDGVQKQSSVFIKGKTDGLTKGMPQEVIKLITEKDLMFESFFKLYEKDGKTVANAHLQNTIYQQEVVNQMNKIMGTLKMTHKESMTSFYYRNQEELIKTQSVLIELAKHLLDYCDEINDVLKSLYYQCLKLICNRGEFDIGSMGFDEGYSELLNNASNMSFKKAGGSKYDAKSLNSKLKVGLEYQNFLYQTLKKTLAKLNQKDANPDERLFVENFCAIAYFRIPEFQRKLLSCLVKPDDPIIQEWRGTEYDINNISAEDEKKTMHFLSLFDWEKDFYRYLRPHPKGEENFAELQDILEQGSWKKRMAKRGVAFFFFLDEWGQYVNKTVVVKDHVPWQDLPGYKALLRALLLEMKLRDVLTYPEALKGASISLLNNRKILNVYVAILFYKTKVWDRKAVVGTLDMIGHWFQYLYKAKLPIQSAFDYVFFLKGIGLIFDQDHCVCIANCIGLLYNNFTLFPPDFKKDLLEYIFGNIFFKLFMHWSYTVRLIFHHFLLFRVFHVHRASQKKIEKTEDLKKEIITYLEQKKGDEWSDEKINILLNEVISMEYSKMMGVLESAKEKALLENNKNEIDIGLASLSRNMKKQLLLKKREEQREQKPMLRDRHSVGSEFEFNLEIEKESSFSILNSSVAERKPRKFSEDFTKIMNNQDLDSSMADDNTNAKHLMDSPENDTSNNHDTNLLRMETTKSTKSGPKRRGSDFNDQTKTPNKKIVQRKYIYYDKKEEKLKQIPKEFLKYLLISMDDYDVVKKSYLKWLRELQAFIPKTATPEEKNAMMLQYKVPEVSVRIPQDESDFEKQAPQDEW